MKAASSSPPCFASRSSHEHFRVRSAGRMRPAPPVAITACVHNCHEDGSQMSANVGASCYHQAAGGGAPCCRRRSRRFLSSSSNFSSRQSDLQFEGLYPRELQIANSIWNCDIFADYRAACQSAVRIGATTREDQAPKRAGASDAPAVFRRLQAQRPARHRDRPRRRRDRPVR